MANPTTNFGWVMPTATDLVTDLPADFAVFGQGVDTSLADLNGGTTGQILSKTSNTNLDFTWVSANPGDITGVTAGVGISGGGTSGDVTVTNSMATAITTSGDLVQGTGSGTFARLGTGTNGQYLTTNGTTNSWGTINAGGMTLLSTTSLTGASTTISGISGSYVNLYIVLKNVRPVSTGNLRFQLNTDTGSNYVFGQGGVTGSTAILNTSNAGTGVLFASNAKATATVLDQCFATIEISRYTDTDIIFGSCFATNTDASNRVGTFTAFAYDTTAAITDITFYSQSGDLTSGTVYIYGVK